RCRRPPLARLFPYTTLSRSHAARRADADHELVRGLEFLAATLVAQVAVILLVAAVELDGALVLEAQRAGGGVQQAFGQRAAQAPDRKSTRLNSSHVKTSYAV